MKKVLVCFLLVNYHVVVKPLELHQLDLLYLSEVQNLFCEEPDSCLTSGTQSFIVPELETTTITKSSVIETYLPVVPPEIPGKRCCGKCSCEVNRCDVTDSCCLEALAKLPQGNDSGVRMTCDYPQLRPYDDIAYPNWEPPKLMFRECPKLGNINTETVNKCENSKNYDEIYTQIPVTDAITTYIYKNRYCAYCHNVTETDLHYWDASLECYYDILQPRSISSVVAEILATQHCNLKYNEPASLGPKGSSYDCTIVISTCNVTGHWKEYDPVIEAACLAYSTVYNFKYRNVFCYLCNTNDNLGPQFCSRIPGNRVFVDFKALLKFQPEENMGNDLKVPDECSVNQIYDPLKEYCRDIECLFPKTVKDGKCVNFVDSLGGVTYGIFLKMTPSEDINLSDRFDSYLFAEDIKEVVISWLNVKLQNTGLISLYIYDRIYMSSPDASYKIAFFVVYVEIAFDILAPVNSDVIDYMLAIQDTFIDTGNVSRNGEGVKYEIDIDAYGVSDVGAQTILDPSAGELNLIIHQGIDIDYPKTVLSALHVCPLVRISSNDFNIIQHSHSVYIEEFNATIDRKEVSTENTTDGKEFSVRMCTAVFQELIEPFATEQLPTQSKCDTETVTANTVLSLVCSSISILFSVVTLIIYLSFKELKTQPGINNIVLCFILIVAQTLFQFGSGQACNVSKVACQIIGTLVHFSWLFLIFWMNICCIHMFRVFRLISTRVPFFNSTKTTMTYLLYSFCASFIFVLINIIVSLKRSEGHDVGYGGSMCYINKDHMVAYLFALPVAVIVFMNIGLFIIVMIQMKNSPKVQNDKNERNMLKIYAKLSTLTGGTWIFGFLTYFLNAPALDYIFIILNASQGMFLFFAFVVNRRTLKLLMKKDHEHTRTNEKTQTSSNDRSVADSTTVTM